MRYLTMLIAALMVMGFVSQGIAAGLPSVELANSHDKKEMKDKSMTDQAIGVVKENPGLTTGGVACGVIIAFFPPALLLCGGAVGAGAGVDHVNKDAK